MKGGVYFTLILTLIIAMVFFFGCAGNGGNGNEPRKGDGEDIEKWVYDVFIDLKGNVKKQIIVDFWEAVEKGYFNGLTGEVRLAVCFGTYNSWVVIGFSASHDGMPKTLIINGKNYILPCHGMNVWKQNANPENNNFYHLQKACDLGFLTLDDLQGLIGGEANYE